MNVWEVGRIINELYIAVWVKQQMIIGIKICMCDLNLFCKDKAAYFHLQEDHKKALLSELYDARESFLFLG